MFFRYILLILALALHSHAGEIVMMQAFHETDTISEPLTIAAGESFKLVGVTTRGTSGAPAQLRIHVGAENFSLNLFDTAGSANFTMPGPVTIRFQRASSLKAFATVEITRAPELTPAIPASASVIPEDANGQFDVLLESTTDGAVWTQAMPGTYGGSTMKRFFRTRIIKKN